MNYDNEKEEAPRTPPRSPRRFQLEDPGTADSAVSTVSTIPDELYYAEDPNYSQEIFLKEAKQQRINEKKLTKKKFKKVKIEDEVILDGFGRVIDSPHRLVEFTSEDEGLLQNHQWDNYIYDHTGKNVTNKYAQAHSGLFGTQGNHGTVSVNSDERLEDFLDYTDDMYDEVRRPSNNNNNKRPRRGGNNSKKTTRRAKKRNNKKGSKKSSNK